MTTSNSHAKPGNGHAKPGNGSASSDRSRDRQGSAFAPAEETHSRPVLVVEDDEATREMLRYLVESAGCSVVTAANGLEALERLRSGITPSLILLDLMMPLMDGCAFDRELARDLQLARIPTVVITAFPERATGLARHLSVAQKPVEIDEILALVTQYAEHDD
jgi:CheY-like chemotaxis protein